MRKLIFLSLLLCCCLNLSSCVINDYRNSHVQQEMIEKEKHQLDAEKKLLEKRKQEFEKQQQLKRKSK